MHVHECHVDIMIAIVIKQCVDMNDMYVYIYIYTHTCVTSVADAQRFKFLVVIDCPFAHTMITHYVCLLFVICYLLFVICYL